MTDERETTEGEATTDPAPAVAGGAAPVVATEEPVAPAVEPVPILRVVPACLLAWAFPGLGHVVLGRYSRGLGFAAIVLALFVGGIALDGKVYSPVPGEPLTYLAAAGAAGVGAPFAIAHLTGNDEGEVTSRYHDYGNTFTLVAGLLNLLVVIDAYDVAMKRR